MLTATLNIIFGLILGFACGSVVISGNRVRGLVLGLVSGFLFAAAIMLLDGSYLSAGLWWASSAVGGLFAASTPNRNVIKRFFYERSTGRTIG